MDIEQLIKKFYEGDTTQEEERFLTNYFLNEKNVDEYWKDEQQLFRLLHAEQIQIPNDVSERLEQSIMRLDGSKKITTRKRMGLYWISSAAAIALLCIGLFFAIRKPVQPQLADTFSDPKQAALVAEQTLTFMSIQLNKGIDKATGADRELEKVNQLLNKHFK